MPPGRFSRHRFTQAILQGDGRLVLSDRVPYTFRDFPDNRRHTVTQGDTLWSLAGIFFRNSAIQRPSGLWWVGADYQPQPIFDPTRALALGRVMHFPSFRTLFEEILSEKRRAEHL